MAFARVYDFLVTQVADRFTYFLTVITGDHRYIHEGKAFKINVTTASIAGSANYFIRFTTPLASTRHSVHWRPSLVSGVASGIRMTLHEAVTTSAVGTAVTPVNMNRMSSTPSLMASTMSVNATATIAGTEPVLQLITAGSGGTPSTVSGGQEGASHEVVLKDNTVYIVRLTNLSATATVADVSLFWYEETISTFP